MNTRQNDVGVTLRGTVKEAGIAVDVSLATVVLVLTPPTGAPRYRPMVFQTDGTDGVVEYVTAIGDLDLVGLWYLQTRATFPSGLDVTSAAVELTVERAPR
jgi:hypothetical protein